MNDNSIVDKKLIERAERGEEAVIAEGMTEGGMPILVLVIVGANVGIFKQHCGGVLPELHRRYMEGNS